MFFIMILLAFVAVGSILSIIDLLLPQGMLIPFVAMGIKYIGIILIWCGIGVYLGRAKTTGAYHIIDLPQPNSTKLLLIGNSGLRVINAIKGELNSLIVKGKNRMRLKDMGYSNYLCGHEIQLACQTVNITIPVLVLDAINKWKTKWGVRNKKEFIKLYNEIKNISSYADVDKIECLKPIMADPEKRKVILDMSLDDIRNLKEVLYDGTTIDIKSYLDWDETGNPFDNESIIGRTLAHRAEQRTSYKYGGMTDWGKIVIPAVLLLIGGAIAYNIFFAGG